MSDFSAPRDNLVRANFDDRASSSVAEDGRTLTGYPIVFDEWTTINSWEGQFRERVAQGAATKTIRESRDQIKALYDHGMDPSIGNKPLGRPSVIEPDARGVYWEVPMSRTSYNEDLIALIQDRALTGQSFRFSVVKDEWVYPKEGRAGMPERTILEFKWFEAGPVSFEAYQATTVGIRSRDAFSAWLGLDDNKRSEISRLMGISFDLRTFDPEAAAEGTSLSGAATDTPSEPLGAHSGVQIIQRRALAAADQLRSSINE